jgi:hypothetical protein
MVNPASRGVSLPISRVSASLAADDRNRDPDAAATPRTRAAARTDTRRPGKRNSKRGALKNAGLGREGLLEGRKLSCSSIAIPRCRQLYLEMMSPVYYACSNQ